MNEGEEWLNLQIWLARDRICHPMESHHPRSWGHWPEILVAFACCKDFIASPTRSSNLRNCAVHLSWSEKSLATIVIDARAGLLGEHHGWLRGERRGWGGDVCRCSNPSRRLSHTREWCGGLENAIFMLMWYHCLIIMLSSLNYVHKIFWGLNFEGSIR